MLRLIRTAWSQLLSLYRIWLLLYVCNLLFALVLAIPFHAWIKNAAGYSHEISDSIGRFDFTFLGDLLRNAPGWQVLLQQTGIMLIVYLLFSVLMMGGVLESITGKSQTKHIGDFFRAGFNWFWKLLGLTGVFLGIHLILICIAVVVVYSLGADPFHMENDVQVMSRLKIIAVILAILMSLVFLVQHYSKLFLVRSEDRRVFKAIGNGFRFVWKNIGRTLLLMLFIWLLFIAGYFLFRAIRGIADDASQGGIFLLFLTGQAFLLWRIGVKLMDLCVANGLIAQRDETKTM